MQITEMKIDQIIISKGGDPMSEPLKVTISLDASQLVEKIEHIMEEVESLSTTLPDVSIRN